MLEQRLQKLNELLHQGLISHETYTESFDHHPRALFLNRGRLNANMRFLSTPKARPDAPRKKRPVHAARKKYTHFTDDDLLSEIPVPNQPAIEQATSHAVVESTAGVSVAQEESLAEDNDPKATDVLGTSTCDIQDAAEDYAAQTAKTLPTEHDINISGFSVSQGSTTFPLRRVSSLTDLRKFTERRNSSQTFSKSEGNISISEFVISFDVFQSAARELSMEGLSGQQPHIWDETDNNEAMQEVERIKTSILTSISETRPEVKEGDERTGEEGTEQEDQCDSCHVMSGIPHQPRKRSYSDSTSLKSPSVFTAEQLRKTKSYTTFPHIQSQNICTTIRPPVHRTFCFRLMPHLSDDSFCNTNYPTISVLSLSSQLDNNYSFNVACEVSSESEDSDKEQSNLEESVLHSWRRPSCRPRSLSEPVSVETKTRARTWSLPDTAEKSSPVYETIHKVKVSPSRLQFPEQSLEKLKEEISLSSQEQNTESNKVRTVSVMSLVDDELFFPQVVPSGEEVTGHWINREQRQSITYPLSFSSVTEVDEGTLGEFEAGDRNQTPAVSLVNQVTEQVLSSHENILSESDDDDQSHTVEAAVRLWKTKESGRRATLASVSPLTDCPKYASEIEQQAFRKIKQWKDNFALKLNNVLGERFDEMAAKREERLNLKKKPKVFKVPMNLSDKEMGQLKNNLLLELKRKSIGEADGVRLPSASFSRPPPIPRVKFPRRVSTDQNPTDLRAQMMKELNRRVSCIPDDDDALHCYKPSSLVPNLSRASLQAKPQSVVYIPRGIDAKTLDFDSIRDLLSWHEAERKRLKAELERLPQAEQAGGQQLLIDRDDANRVLQSMMKIMEDIFTGTMKRFMGSEVPATHVDEKRNRESKMVAETSDDDVKESDFHIVETGCKEDGAKVDDGLKLNNEVSILSTSDSTKSFSSETSTELLSSESSLTGISFTSSNGASDVSEKLDKACPRTDDVLAMLGSDAQVRLPDNLQSISGKSAKGSDSVTPSTHPLVSEGKTNDQLVYLENSHDNDILTSEEAKHSKFPKTSKSTEEALFYSKPIFECCNVTEGPGEFVKTIVCRETCVNDKQIQIQQLRRALQDKTNSEDLLKRRFESLKNGFSRIENKSDYWFNQCIKKGEKIKELLIRARDMNSFNIELRQQIDNKSKIITEKDNEIKRISSSKTETEALLQEVNIKLSKANEEVERLKLIVRRSLKENKLHSIQMSVQADETSKEISSKFVQFHGHPLESKKCKDNGNPLERKKFMAIANDKFDTPRKRKKDNTVKAITFWSDETVKREPLKASEFDGSSSLKSIPLRATNYTLKEKKTSQKAGISEWLSEVIRYGKVELARERLLISSSKKPSVDQKLPGHSLKKTCDNEAVKYSLKDIISSFTERIPKKTKRQSEGHLLGFDKRPFVLSNSDGKVNRQQTLTTHLSTITFDDMLPFADVFLTKFEYMDFSSVDSLVSLEPFGDLFVPWLGSEDAQIKQMVRSVDPTAVTTELYLNKDVHLDNEKNNLETVPRKQKVRANKSNVIQERPKKTAAEREVKPFFDNRHLFLKGMRTAKQCMSVPLTETSATNGTTRDHSDGLITRINNVSSCSGKFPTAENSIEHLIAELDSKTKSFVTSPTDQQRPVGKVLHFKLNDSKFIPSTRNKAVLSNSHGFTDSISVDLKLNTEQEQLIKELANRKLFETQRLKAGLTAQDSLKNLSLERMNWQRKKYLASVFDEMKGICSPSSRLDQKRSTQKSSMGGNGRSIRFVCKYGAEISKHAEDITKRWFSDLRKHICDNKKRDASTNSVTGERPMQPQYGTSSEALTITKPKRKDRSNIVKSQPFEKGNFYSGKHNTETKRLAGNILSDHKRLQKKAERDLRIAMWQEKVGCLGNKSKDKNNDDKNMDHGLVWNTGDTKITKSRYLKNNCQNDDNHSTKEHFKFSGRLKSSKMRTKTEARLMPDQIIQSRKSSSPYQAGVAVKAVRDPYEARFDSCSTKKKRDMDYLMNMYKSTADVLERQENQKKAIQKCKNKVLFMTEELEILQRRTDEEKGAKMTSSQLASML